MEFREISTFLQVAKFKSFSRAAEQLGYTQAAVTIQIKIWKMNSEFIFLIESENRRFLHIRDVFFIITPLISQGKSLRLKMLYRIRMS